MSLAIYLDAGNTRCKLGIFTDRGALCREVLAYPYSQVCQDELTSEISSIAPQVSLICWASVTTRHNVQPLISILTTLCSQAQCIELTHDDFDRRDFVYQEFSKLGLDRIIGIEALRQRAGTAAMLIDAGSAMTADLIDEAGQHIGGYIFPGLALLSEAVQGRTAKVKTRSTKENCLTDWDSPGRSTEECLFRAVQMMLYSTLEKLVYLAAKWKLNKVYVTGGDAAQIANAIASVMSEEASVKRLQLIEDSALLFHGIHGLVKRKGLLGDVI